MKRYVITSQMLSNVTFEFAGNNNEASVVLANAQVVDSWADILRDKDLVKLSGKRPFRITKARLSFQGADGLGQGGGIAAKLDCSLNAAGTGNKAVANFAFKVSRFGEWEDKDILVKPVAVDEDWDGFSGDEFIANRYCLFTIKSGSALYINDFNVQDAFIGETRKAILDLEIEADAVLDATTGEAV